MEPHTITEKKVVESTLLMLIGVQSWLFSWDNAKEVSYLSVSSHCHL